MSESCLVEKLSHYIHIDEVAHGHLAALEETSKAFGKHRDIVCIGDTMDRLYVVKQGWLYGHTDMPDGRRQIIRVLHPGDIIGFPDIAFEHATCNVRSAEDVLLCPFPKKSLDVLFKESPKLTALLFTLVNRELASSTDHLRAMGRMSARERIGYFLLDLISRLRITNKSMTDTMRLPLNQQEIGDTLGLTHTYVSKTLREMEDDGLLARNNGTIKLIQEGALRDMCEFTNRHSDLDTSWFPQTDKPV